MIIEVGKLSKRKKYGLVWENKKEEVVESCKKKLPVLAEDKNKEIMNNQSNGVNVLIEGDSYHALSVLNYTHKGKIDVIYIDPPYNTGNSNFIFNDRYVDIEDEYRHSKWISFMEKRLKLARNLLKSTGVIFISIDDNEMPQLRLLCDEIFLEKNRLDRGMLIWNNAGSTRGFRNIVKNHEYILAYAKNFGMVKNYFGENFPNELGVVEDRLQIKRTKRNPICRLKFLKGTPIEGVKDIKFEGSVGGTTNNIDIINRPMIFKNGKLAEDVILEASFPYRFQVEKYYKNLETGEKTYDAKGQEIISIFFRKNGVPYYRKMRNIQVLGSILENMPNSGLKDLQEILPHVEFSNPKPVELIEKLLAYFAPKDGIILDFMEGSGTTGQAVIEINKKDKGKRRFILVNLNEKKEDKEVNICTDICYPRLKKAIGNKENLKYFKTDFVDAEPTDKNKVKLTRKATEILCLREETYEKVMEKEAFKIYRSNDKYTGIIFDNKAIEEFKEEAKKLNGRFSVYVFSLGGDTFDDEFEDLRRKVKIIPIPESILNTYKKIFGG